MNKLYKFHSVEELLQVAEEYYEDHPEGDHKDHVVSTSQAQIYHEGVIDFLQWLVNGKRFLYDYKVTGLAAFEELSDREEEENIQRDETY